MTEITFTAERPGAQPAASGEILVSLVDGGAGGGTGRGTVIGGTRRVRLDATGTAVVDLDPNTEITPAGTCWRCTLVGASPSLVRHIVVGDTPTTWADESIQVALPVPPVWVPVEGPPGPPGPGGGGATGVAFFLDGTDDLPGGSFTSIHTISGAAIPRVAVPGQPVLVVDGDDLGLWVLTASGPCTPGAALTINQVVTEGFTGRIAVATSNNGVSITGVEVLPSSENVAAVLAALNAAFSDPEALQRIPLQGFGIMGKAGNAEQIATGWEGTLDRFRWISAFSTVPFDTSTVMAGPVDPEDQPTLDDGTIPVAESDVWLFAQTDPTDNGCYSVLINGRWERRGHPSIFDPPGNGYRLVVNASDSTADGTVFMWTDDDRRAGARACDLDSGHRSGYGRWHRQAAPVAVFPTVPLGHGSSLD